jgi:hypothetical protein
MFTNLRQYHEELHNRALELSRLVEQLKRNYFYTHGVYIAD